MAYILGLTGGIACGKTTIGLMLLELGAYSYDDADQVVHELYLPGRPLVERLVQEFGSDVLGPDGGVDRQRLGDVVFGDVAALRRLEAIVHPAVQQALLGRLRSIPEQGVGVLDAVKLVESGYAPLCHGVWVVQCSRDVQLRRLMQDRGLTRMQAEQRLDVQPSMEPRLSVATEVIHNDGPLEQLGREVAIAWQRFLDANPGSERMRRP
jgi:dephospho-CoA kinase